jgi:hypothetical protein
VTGAQGAQGATGATGATGAIGATGANGLALDMVTIQSLFPNYPMANDDAGKLSIITSLNYPVFTTAENHGGFRFEFYNSSSQPAPIYFISATVNGNQITASNITVAAHQHVVVIGIGYNDYLAYVDTVAS